MIADVLCSSCSIVVVVGVISLHWLRLQQERIVLVALQIYRALHADAPQAVYTVSGKKRPEYFSHNFDKI